jgi:7-keto-8-aminopelargonate synthetase-like enzyme
MSRLTSELDDALEERAARGLRRERRIVDSAQGARLRIAFSASHSIADVDLLAEALADVAR